MKHFWSNFLPSLWHLPLYSGVERILRALCEMNIRGGYKECSIYLKKVKWSRYTSGVAQRVVRGIALLFHDRGTRRLWVVSSTLRPYFTTGKDPVPIVQEAGWAPGPVWKGGKSRPHRDSIPDRPARSSVTIPTELPGPRSIYLITQKQKVWILFLIPNIRM